MNTPTAFFQAPTVFEQLPGGITRAWSIESKLLEEEKTIFLTGPFNDAMADQLVKQLMYLKQRVNAKGNDKITIYLNSPGGQVTSGMAVYDVMQNMGCPVEVIAMGLAASMGSFILMAGTKGHRRAFRNAEIMIHQPSGGSKGQATDIEIAAKWILRTKERMNELYARHCGGTPAEWGARMERDNWLTAEEALAIGLIDEIIG